MIQRQEARSPRVLDLSSCEATTQKFAREYSFQEQPAPGTKRKGRTGRKVDASHFRQMFDV